MHCTPAMSSGAIERMFVWPGLPDGNIVAPLTVECPRPSACPYSWQITPSMSQRLAIVPGPSSHSHSSHTRMRQPSEIGVSVKASVPPPPQVAMLETMLLLVEPMPPVLPAQNESKFAPPLPSVL